MADAKERDRLRIQLEDENQRRIDEARLKWHREESARKQRIADYYDSIGICPVADIGQVQKLYRCLPEVPFNAAIDLASVLIDNPAIHGWDYRNMHGMIRDALLIEKMKKDGEAIPNSELESYLEIVIPRFGVQILAAAEAYAIYCRENDEIMRKRNAQSDDLKNIGKAVLLGGLIALGISVG